MGISITSSVNLNDTTNVSSGLPVTVTGRSFPAEPYFYTLYVNNVEVGFATSASNSFTIIGITANEIYLNAKEKPFTNAIRLDATDGSWTDTTSKLGNLTINGRLSSFSLSTPSVTNKLNMDLADPVNIVSSWTNPYSGAFYGRIKGYVGNSSGGASTTWTQVFSRPQFNTGSNFDVVDVGYDDEIIAAMSSSSPKDLKFELITQFRTGTSTYTDLSGISGTATVASGVTRTFVTLSDIAFSNFTIDGDLVTNNLPYTLTTYYAGVSHTVKLYVNSVLIKTVTGITESGSLDIDSTDLTAMLTATDQVNSALAYLSVETFVDAVSYGTKNSNNVTATVGTGYVPVFTAQAHAEATTSPDVATLIGKYVKSISTIKFTFSGNVTGTGTRIKQTRAVVSGQTITTDYTYASNTTTLTSATLTSSTLSVNGTGLIATLTITDWRDRSTTYTWNDLEVLNYTFPTVNSLDVVRSDSGGNLDTVGVFMKVILNAQVQSLINSTEKNELYYRIGYRVKGVGSYTYYTEVDTNALTFNSFEVKGTAVTQEFSINDSYDIVVEVYDVLTSANKTLATDLLPYGKVAMMWGDDWVSVGKVYDGVGALDVGSDDSGISITANGKIQTVNQFKSTIATGTSPLDVASTTVVTNLNADMLDGYHIGSLANNVPIISTGTFTPTLVRTTTNPTLTYSVQSGFYYKIGNLAFMTVMITANITSSGSGNWRIAGFPFNTNNTTNYRATLSTGLSFAGCDGGYFLENNSSPYLTANGALITATTTGTVNLYVSTIYEVA